MKDARQEQFKNFGKADNQQQQQGDQSRPSKTAGDQSQYGNNGRQQQADSQRDSQGRFEEGNTQGRNSQDQDQAQRGNQNSGQNTKGNW